MVPSIGSCSIILMVAKDPCYQDDHPKEYTKKNGGEKKKKNHGVSCVSHFLSFVFAKSRRVKKPTTALFGFLLFAGHGAAALWPEGWLSPGENGGATNLLAGKIGPQQRIEICFAWCVENKTDPKKARKQKGELILGKI